MTDETLTKHQEELLIRHIDGECGFLDRFRAQRLLNTSEHAREFVAACQSLGESIVAASKECVLSEHKIDIADSVLARIKQEERAQLFLGERKSEGANSLGMAALARFLGVSEGSELFGKSAWGLSGAVVAAGLTFLVLNNRSDIAASNQLAAEKTQSDLSQAVPVALDQRIPTAWSASSGSLGANAYKKRMQRLMYRQNVRYPSDRSQLTGAFVEPKIIDQTEQAMLEVDWMRSDGSVRVLSDPIEGSPIIWVKKKSLR